MEAHGNIVTISLQRLDWRDAGIGFPAYTAMGKPSVYYGDTSFHSLEIKGYDFSAGVAFPCDNYPRSQGVKKSELTFISSGPILQNSSEKNPGSDQPGPGHHPPPVTHDERRPSHH